MLHAVNRNNLNAQDDGEDAMDGSEDKQQRQHAKKQRRRLMVHKSLNGDGTLEKEESISLKNLGDQVEDNNDPCFRLTTRMFDKLGSSTLFSGTLRVSSTLSL